MDALSDQIVWIHCALNHRVSAFLYQYRRLTQNLKHEEAEKVMLESCSRMIHGVDLWPLLMNRSDYNSMGTLKNSRCPYRAGVPDH